MNSISNQQGQKYG
jgi:hypothetical protein